MSKKLYILLLTMVVILMSTTPYCFAEKLDSKGKVIVVNINKTNLTDLYKIESLKRKLSQSGYIGLMNIKGDKGTDDARSIASMGAGTRAYIPNQVIIDFNESSDKNKILYESTVGEKAKNINAININQLIQQNDEKGSYDSILGLLGTTLSDNNLKTALLGNSDIIDNQAVIKNRNLGLLAMDEYGRIDYGNIENINVEDDSMPYGIRTDYEKLAKEVDKFYNNSDSIFIDLGDTYRLDKYKSNLTESQYSNIKDSIYDNINLYLGTLFKTLDKNDTLYIISAIPNSEDMKNNRKLSPIIKFKGDGKGLLYSPTTRRDGIVGNIDIGADIVNEFGLKNTEITGKSFETVNKLDNVQYLDHEYNKIVSIVDVQMIVIIALGVMISVAGICLLISIVCKKIPYRNKIASVSKEFLKLGIIMPLAILTAPVFNFTSQVSIGVSILILIILIYIFGRIIFKTDMKQMLFFSLITVAIIVIDSAADGFLMKNNIMSYDPIVGERYYGVGNEYGGVIMAASIFALSILIHFKKMPKYISVIIFTIILITSAYPSMGASVGGSIAGFVAYLFFILLIYDVKIDYKKIIILIVGAIAVVGLFATLDILTSSESHLSLFVNKIHQDGIQPVISTFTRKIKMNVNIAKTSIGVVLLIIAVILAGISIMRPTKYFKKLYDDYRDIYKGFIAIFVGSIVSLVVNDTGVVALATSSIYLLIPLIIMSANILVLDKSKLNKL